MVHGFNPRLPIGVALSAASAAAGFLLGADLNAVMVALVGGVAAVLVVAARGEGDAPDQRMAMVDGPLPRRALSVQSVIEGIGEPLLVVSDGRVACANRAACVLLGAHIVGEDVRLAIRHPAAAERLLPTGAHGGGRDGPVHLVGLGAREQHWEMRVHPIDAGRDVVHLADRTGAHAAERMRVDFVANASHELRTPLASLLGFIETLQDDAGEDAGVRNRFLKVMQDEARRMQRLIDDLISLSRIEATKYRLPDQSIDLADLTQEVCAGLTASGGARGGDIAFVRPAGGATVVGDRSQLSQILYNVIGNAMKYGRPGTPVAVTLEDAPRAVRLVVADQGDGIAPEHLPRLTERFYRVDSGRSRALGGTGLGLAIVKHIVERHRGRLDIASTPGTGTTVTITLPAASARSPSGATTGATVIKP